MSPAPLSVILTFPPATTLMSVAASESESVTFPVAVALINKAALVSVRVTLPPVDVASTLNAAAELTTVKLPAEVALTNPVVVVEVRDKAPTPVAVTLPATFTTVSAAEALLTTATTSSPVAPGVIETAEKSSLVVTDAPSKVPVKTRSFTTEDAFVTSNV